MEVSLKDIKELLSKTITSSPDNPYPAIGKSVFIRTVTMAYTGRLVFVGEKELVLEDCAWIADTGRFSEFLKTGNLNEVEPFPSGRVIVGRGAIVDCCEWNHRLPRETK